MYVGSYVFLHVYIYIHTYMPASRKVSSVLCRRVCMYIYVDTAYRHIQYVCTYVCVCCLPCLTAYPHCPHSSPPPTHTQEQHQREVMELREAHSRELEELRSSLAELQVCTHTQTHTHTHTNTCKRTHTHTDTHTHTHTHTHAHAHTHTHTHTHTVHCTLHIQHTLQYTMHH